MHHLDSFCNIVSRQSLATRRRSRCTMAPDRLREEQCCCSIRIHRFKGAEPCISQLSRGIIKTGRQCDRSAGPSGYRRPFASVLIFLPKELLGLLEYRHSHYFQPHRTWQAAICSSVSRGIVHTPSYKHPIKLHPQLLLLHLLVDLVAACW